MTTKEITDAWIDNHLPREWKGLLAAYTKTPALPGDVLTWLAEFVPGFKVKMRNGFTALNERPPTDALAKFENEFIANVSAAVERPG